MRKVLVALLVAALLTALSAAAVAARPDRPAVPAAEDIERVVFIHYKAPEKPSWAGGPKDKPGDDNGGYKLFRGGVKWSDAALGENGVSYRINTGSIPAYLVNLDAVAQIKAAFEAWDAKTTKELFNDTVVVTSIAGADGDGVNVIVWVDLGTSSVIAVTTFWYNVKTKELLEFDIEFNTRFIWGIDPDGEGDGYILEGAMDIKNIATHEVGHTLVLDDLYQKQYAQLTMYGYSDYGEVKKVSLEPGDVAGLYKLYGE